MNLLQSLIAEFHERPIAPFTPRSGSLPEAPSHANVLIGMRRSGKTYRLFQEMDRLLSAGVPKKHLLHVNFEDERLGAIGVKMMGELLETFYRGSPDARSRRSYLFFDEIQNVPQWERFVRRVLDTEDARVYLTGSSAKLLSTEVATALRGRCLTTEVLPYGYAEFLAHAGTEVPVTLPGARMRSTLEAATLDYLTKGGFPAVQRLTEGERIGLLQDYVELVVFRDVVERHGVGNFQALRYLVRHLLDSCARPFSINKSCNDLKSQGLAVGKDTLHAYLAHLADAFLVFTVPIYRRSYRARLVNPRKVYAIDPGLARAMSHSAASDVGALLEDAVYLELRRRTGRTREGSISYVLTRGGHEVDFAVDRGESLELVQVCADVSDPGTLGREVRALVEAKAETGAGSAVIVTLHGDRVVDTAAGPIRVVPAWRWMLGLVEPR
ncbi:MAG: ATP-binding protein [Candidatus Riflebacteria bacterium]|nr:ATP-binding protein [Candidatus Riflebacteria bacterium]